MVCTLLQQDNVRLVTVTGPGSIGKTRLAIAATERARAAFDAMVFVPLASVNDVESLLPEVAHTLDVGISGILPVLEQLTTALRGRRSLLVLDNGEQLLGAANDIAELLAMADGLTIMVTSRAPLRFSGEHEVRLPPLALPDPTAHMSPVELGQTEAVQLFVERARAARFDS